MRQSSQLKANGQNIWKSDTGSKLVVSTKKGYIFGLVGRGFLYSVRNLRGCWWARETMYLISMLKDSLFIHKTCNAVLNGKWQLFIRFLLHLVLFFTVLVFTGDTLNQTSILYLLKSSMRQMWLIFEIHLCLLIVNSNMHVTVKRRL